MSEKHGIQVIARAAAILRLLGRRTEGLSLGQIAAEVALPRSTVQRIVGALIEEGLVMTTGTRGGLKLGPEVSSLSRAALIDPKDRFRPVLEEIFRATGETVDLAVLQDGRMLFVDQIVGEQRLRTVSRIGDSFPLSTTANGKAALSCLEEAEATRMILTERDAGIGGERDLVSLLKELAEVRRGALARDAGEHTEGICALGFAQRLATNQIYAISVPVPSSRFERISKALVAALMAAQARCEAMAPGSIAPSAGPEPEGPEV